MKAKKPLIFLFFLMALPLVAANINIQCPSTPVAIGGSINCVVRTDSAITNMGTLFFTINPSSLFEFPSDQDVAVVGLAGKTFNTGNGRGVYTVSGGRTFAAGELMFQINLIGRSEASGTEQVSFSRFEARDLVDNLIGTGPLASSNFVRVGAVTTSATISLSCSPATVSARGPVACVVSTDTILNNVGTISFIFEEGALFDFPTIPADAALTGLTGVTFNAANGAGVYTATGGRNFAQGSMFTVNLLAGSTAGRDSTSFSRFVVRDLQDNLINTGNLPVSNSITITAACTPVTATCVIAGVACPGNTPVGIINCQAGQICNSNSGQCQAVSACTPVVPTSCTNGISCSSGVATPVAASGCSSGQICENNNCVPQLPRCSPSDLGACTTDLECVAAGGRFNSATGTCSARTCTPRAATCARSGVSCDANNNPTSIQQVTCPSSDLCNQNNGACEPNVVARRLVCDAVGGQFDPSTLVCTPPSGLQSCGCTTESQDAVANCQPEAGWDIVRGKCTRLLQNIKTSINDGNDKLSILASIARWFRQLFNGLFP